MNIKCRLFGVDYTNYLTKHENNLIRASFVDFLKRRKCYIKLTNWLYAYVVKNF